MKTIKQAGPISAEVFSRNEKGGPRSATLCRLSALLNKEDVRPADKAARGEPRKVEQRGYTTT